MSSDSNFGISGQDMYYEVYFNDPSMMLIQHTGRKVVNGYTKSLYSRHINDDKYSLLASGTPDLSYEELLVSHSSAYVYANVVSLKSAENDKGGTSVFQEWQSVVRIDLGTGKEETLFSKESEVVMGEGEKSWVNHIISMGADDNDIIFTLGTMPTQGGRREVRYDLCRYSCDRGTIQKLTKMLSPLF